MNQNPIVENPRIWNSIVIADAVIIIVTVITIKFHHANFWYLFMIFLLCLQTILNKNRQGQNKYKRDQ